MDNLPWFWPGLVLSCAFGVLAGRRLATMLGTSRALSWSIVVASGLIVSSTLTPLRGVFGSVSLVAGRCDLSRVGFPPLEHLLSINDTSLNLALFVPLGVAIAMVPPSRRRTFVILGTIAAPFVIEAVQSVFPVLSRDCESADVIDNLSGFAIGLIAGSAISRLGRGRARDQPSRESTSSE